MQFAFTDEQSLIRESVASACDSLCSSQRLFLVIEKEGGFHKEAWKVLCTEMGLGLTSIPETKDGLGLGVIELASIMEKMGRVLLPTPFFTSIVLSASALTKGRSDPSFDKILSDVASGEKISSFGFMDEAGKNQSTHSAVISDDGQVSGSFGFVQYGQIADYFILLAKDTNGTPCLAVISSEAKGIKTTPKSSIDMTRPLADLSLDNVDIVGGKPLTNDPKVISDIFDIGRICLASEQLGASEAVLEKTRNYALERHQFGRAIGSFQAVKHRLADMMVLNEAAKSAAWYAACAADEIPDELSVAAATAMTVTTRALKRNSKNMLQLHGGMGFTWECEAHLYMKRVELSARLLGDETVHRETLAAHALGETS